VRSARIDPPGYDAGKKIKGEKRHILVDTLGLLLHAIVHPANIQDRDGGIVMATLFGMFPFLNKLFADGGYQGPRFANALAAVVMVRPYSGRVRNHSEEPKMGKKLFAAVGIAGSLLWASSANAVLAASGSDFASYVGSQGVFSTVNVQGFGGLPLPILGTTNTVDAVASGCRSRRHSVIHNSAMKMASIFCIVFKGHERDRGRFCALQRDIGTHLVKAAG
jgi:hypothetical protein